MLSQDCFNQAKESILLYARPLEKSILERYFNGGSNQQVLEELIKFQNDDGGFGHGLESDFRLPYSSPMATSVGLRLLSEINDIEESYGMIKTSIAYLETSFDKKRNGWFALTKEVNNFPHAPWWHYKEDTGMTIIDLNWGNPSAEILGYLYKYREYVVNLNVDRLVEYAITYLENKQEFNSENEIFCYIKFYEVLPDELKKRLEPRIAIAIEQVIVYDEQEWYKYVPTPVDFLKTPSSNSFGVLESKLNINLNFIVNQLDMHGRINPPWGADYYKEDLKEAYHEWIGVLTLKALITLHHFKRIAV